VEKILDVLHGDRFINTSPAEVYATLLDEGTYLASCRTMYRILDKHGEVKERRALCSHGNYKKPEFLATAPNQVWSWDTTRLLGPQKWTYFYLYVLMDIFSRYVVGWMVSGRESALLAKALIGESCEKQGILENSLIIHSDRGAPMTSKPVAHLMADLGVIKSLSRPQVSNDNPFSEAQFKTLKYSPAFPDRFGCLEDAQVFCRRFVSWYNREHKHSGIGYYSPEDVHYGKVNKLRALRQKTLESAFKTHPERFVNKTPVASSIPREVWINPPVGSNLPQGGGLMRDMPKTCPQPAAPFVGPEQLEPRSELRKEDMLEPQIGN
jgi:putative transposase